MMHFYGALILFVTVSAACGLSCYTCIGKACTFKLTCPARYDRCASVTLGDFITQSCMNSTSCKYPMMCCSTDLCNGIMLTGSSGHGAVPVWLLLASSAIISLFL